jgi:hypothetical protein
VSVKRISDHDLQNAVLELFAQRGLQAGDVMWLSRLETFWSQTRLRRWDLVVAISQLCSQGVLDVEQLGDQVNLSLTAPGEQRVTQEHGAGEFLRFLQEELMPAVRQRVRAEGDPGRDRRKAGDGAGEREGDDTRDAKPPST